MKFKELCDNLLNESVMYAKINELPKNLQSVLKSYNYNKRDILLKPANVIHPQYMGEGRRAVLVFIDMTTGETESYKGSFGGMNAFSTTIDNIEKDIPVPVNKYVLQGEEGGWGTMMSLIVHPESMAKVLPDNTKTELSDNEKKALELIKSMNTSGRKDYFRYHNLGDYSTNNQYVKALSEKGLVKLTASGGVSLTLKGKNNLV